METVACRGCDLLQRVPPLPAGAKAKCARCGEPIAVRHADPLDRPLALALTAAVLLVIANAFPLMTLSAEGRESTTTLAGGVVQMWRQGSEVTAVIVGFCAVAAPLCHVALMLAVLLLARRPPAPHAVAEMMRWLERVKPWSMNEVLLLGILVALTKIAQLATVVPGIAMYAVGGLVLLLPAIASTFDPDEVWRRIAWAAPGSAAGRGA
ncbi:MAG: paraquat-inducible protein A [Burkholderiales bacterium]